MYKDFELIPHTADVQLRVYGATQEQLFTHALAGMFQIMRPQSSACFEQHGRLTCTSFSIKRQVDVSASDMEQLLVDFLSAVLSLSDIYNEAYGAITFIQCTPTHVQAYIQGVSITGFSGVEIKAVTYHDLAIRKSSTGFQVDIVFDI